ncbi:MAG: GerAB/ArcD/ProY family transporter [Coprococcus sp.]
MAGDNQMISLRQTSWVLALDILAAGLFWLPACLGGRSFIGMMLTGIFVLMFIFLYYVMSFCWLSRKYGTNSEAFRKQDLPFVLCVFYIFYYLAAAVYSMHYFYRVIEELIPADYSYPVTILFLLAAVVYGAGKGIEVRGRMAELMGWLVYVPFLVLFASGFWQAVGYGWPMDPYVGNEYHWSHILSGSYGALWFFFLADHPFLIWRRTNMNQRGEKTPVKGVAGGCLLVFAALALTGLFFTPEGMAAEEQPFGVLLQMIRFPGNFISRYDVFFIMLWMLSFYIFAGGMLLEIVELNMELLGRVTLPGQNGTGETDRRNRMKPWIALFFGVLILILSGLAKQWDRFDVVFSKWMLWLGVPVCVLLIPVGVWKWRKVERNGAG